MKARKNIFWWIALVAGLVAVNFIASKLHSRFDLTEEKRYSITPTTKQLIRNLSSDVVIDVFLKGDFPSGFRKLANSTEEFLAILKDENPGRIKYRFISPGDDAGNGKTWGDSLRAAGIEPINLSVQVQAGEENKNIFPYAVVRANNQIDVVNLFPSSKRSISFSELNSAEAMMEYGFVKSLDKLNSPQRPSVAYAIGNGEPTAANTFDLTQVVGNSYDLKLLNIKNIPFIPKEASVLMIVKPDSAFSENEKLKIDQYIMNGGKVLMFIDALFAEQDSLAFKSQLIAYDRNLNIGDLLFNYGVRINDDLVMDLQCDFMQFVVGGTASDPQYEPLQWNYWPLFESRNNHSINKNLGLISARFVNSIDTIEAAGIKKTFLLQTSPNSRSISTPVLISLNENRNVPEDAKFNKNGIPVAVLLEGKFSSIYKNRISKVQADSLAKSGGFKETSNAESKIIVVADGDMVLNDVFNKQGPLPMGMNKYTIGSRYEYPAANREFLLNCLEYLTGNPNVISTRNKEVVLRLLDTKKTEGEKTKWQLITIALPIVLVIVFGIIYQGIRRRRFAS